MKTLTIGLLFALFLGAGGSWVSATITERVIYAGDTPLKSTCTVTQTGPMELTAAACQWTTTGEARVFSVLQSLIARTGFGELAQSLAEDKAEWSHNGTRVRAWLRDKQGNIIARSRTRVLTPTVLSITAGETWVVYMVDGPGVTMNLVLEKWDGDRPENTLDYLLLPFEVPAGITDLGGIKIEVFTVKSGHVPVKGLFEK